MHHCITSFYYRLFYYLEHNDLLDPINDVDLFALHYLESIDHYSYLLELETIIALETEHSLTPHQSFTSGSLRLQMQG